MLRDNSFNMNPVYFENFFTMCKRDLLNYFVIASLNKNNLANLILFYHLGVFLMHI